MMRGTRFHAPMQKRHVYREAGLSTVDFQLAIAIRGLLLETSLSPMTEIVLQPCHYASASPLRKASRARTSVTYWRASSMGTRCKRSLSVGSFIQPSMGIALSVFQHQIVLRRFALWQRWQIR